MTGPVAYKVTELGLEQKHTGSEFHTPDFRAALSPNQLAEKGLERLESGGGPLGSPPVRTEHIGSRSFFSTVVQKAPEKQPVGGLMTEACGGRARPLLPEPLTATSEQLAAVLACVGALTPGFLAGDGQSRECGLAALHAKREGW